MSHARAHRRAAVLALASLAAACGGGSGAGGGGGGPPAAVLSLSGASDLGTALLGGAAAEADVVVENAAGGADATSLAASFEGAFSRAGGDCGASLAPGASCTIRVAFAPAARGAATGSIAVAYHDGRAVRAASRALSGTGRAPATLAFEAAPVATFEDAAVGGATSLRLTVTNTGDLDATSLAALPLAGPWTWTPPPDADPPVAGEYPGAGGTCRATLARGASCTLDVSFAPAAPGPASGAVALAFASGAGDASATIALAGRGARPAHLDVAGSGAFGGVAVGAVSVRTMTVTNSGEVSATALAPAFSGAGFGWAGGEYPGAGGTCGDALAPGVSCTLVLAFAPSMAGPAAGGLDVWYVDGAAWATAPTVPLAAAALVPATVSMSGDPEVDFGTPVVGTSGAAVVTLANDGEAPATALAATVAAPFAFAGGAYPGASGTCGTALEPGATCTLALVFAPAAAGPADGTLSVAYHDGALPRAAERALAATAIAPAALALGGPADLGAVIVGRSAEADLVLSNAAGGAGASPLLVSLSGPFARAGGDCGASLAPGASCTIRVAFAPGARGEAAGSVAVAYDDGAAARTASRALSGAGLLPAALAPPPAPVIDLGDAATGASSAAFVSLTNAGDIDAAALRATFSGPFGFAGGAFPGRLGTCGPVLGPGATCTLDLAFLPADRGAATGEVVVSFDDGLGPATRAYALAGTGLAPASLEVAGSGDFGGALVGTRATRAFTVTNAGEVAATVLSLGLDAPFEWGAAGACTAGARLGPGERCTVEVAFAPVAPCDAWGELSLNYSDETGARGAARALAGRGLSPASLTLSDGAAYDYGAVAVGGRLTHVVRVTNEGEWPAALGALAAPAPFGFAGGAAPGTGGSCGPTLGAGFSCLVVLAFEPSAEGAAAGALSVPYDDGARARVRTLSLAGAGTARAFLSVTDWPPRFYASDALPDDGGAHDYGAVAAGQPASHAFHVTNTGAVAATALASGGLSGPFDWSGGAFPGAGGTCGAALAPGETCEVVVDFTPPSARAASGAFTIAYDDGAAAQGATRALSGSGTARASLALYDEAPSLLYGDTWDFGPTGVGIASEHAFLVVNAGARAATAIAGLAPPDGFEWKGGAFPGAGGTCAAALAAGASCRAVAAFRPGGPGLLFGDLAIAYDDGSGAVQTAARLVRGAGVTRAVLAIEPDDAIVVSVGEVGVGEARDRALVVRNVGGVDATGIAARPLPDPFSLVPAAEGACGATLAPGAECITVVRFAPGAAGGFVARVVLDYEDGQGGATAVRDLAGTGAGQALPF